VNGGVRATERTTRASELDFRLRRAVPLFGSGAPPPPEREAPEGVGTILSLVRRAWPYIYRYIGGRWIGLGKQAAGEGPGSGGLLYMPLLVTVLAALAFQTASTAGGHGGAGVYWARIGHGLGLGLAVLAWLTWLARGRLRTTAGLVGAIVGLGSATLVWIAEPSFAGKVLGLAVLTAYVAGAALRVVLRGGVTVWLRIESHLIYYYVMYAACTSLLALNTAYLTDVLYQSILSAKPMATGIAGLASRLGAGAALQHGLLPVDQRHTLQFYYVAIFMAGFLFSVPTLYVALPYYYTYIHQKINQHLRLDLMDHWHKLSPRYHANHRVGDSIYRVYLDSAQISNIISRVQIAFMSSISWVVACFIALFFDWRIAALIAGMAAPMFLWAYWYTPRLKRSALAAREAASALTSRAQEILGGARVIKAYGQEDREQARFEADSVAAFDAALRARFLFVVIGVVAFTICALMMMPVVYMMAVWAGAGRATLAAGLIGLVGVSFSRWNLAAFTWGHGRFGRSAIDLRDLNTEWASAQDNAMGLTRVFDILETEPEVTDRPDAQAFGDFSREIRFEQVGFAYDPGRPILQDVTFTAGVGSITAIVGPTGSGKSTLMALLLRLFDPDQGRILVDGRDLRDFTVESLRDNISIAPQEPVLFAATVAENLRYAVPAADSASLSAAACVACADDFLRDLPQGWDTVLGERGAGLSPGQKQRLCIARALVKAAPILILDEPTASLDAETEHRLMGNLGQWASGRAVFVITHRLSTIQHADQILFIDEGRVIEAGAHAALMADPASRYRAMVAAERALAVAEPTT
jgi:ABC-type multidrug transport system fused ATPase/permease subunit